MTTEPRPLQPEQTREIRASWMLVLVTALWGMSFTWTHNWQAASRDHHIGELLSALTLIGLRMPLALLLLGLWQPAVIVRPGWREHLGGCLLGTVFFAGFSLQTWGLAFTTPALSAFFTCLCSVWVPLLLLLVFRERVPPFTLAGLALALIGCAFLVDGWSLGRGDWLTVASSVLFAVQMLVLDRLGRSLEPRHLSVGFLATTGMLALVGAVVLALGSSGVRVWWTWTWAMLHRPEVGWNLLCLAIFPTVLGFHWMNTYQPRVTPGRAALIYLLEPIFSSAFSIAWGPDHLTRALLVGGALILLANLLVEIPRLLVSRRGISKPHPVDSGAPSPAVGRGREETPRPQPLAPQGNGE